MTYKQMLLNIEKNINSIEKAQNGIFNIFNKLKGNTTYDLPIAQLGGGKYFPKPIFSNADNIRLDVQKFIPKNGKLLTNAQYEKNKMQEAVAYAEQKRKQSYIKAAPKDTRTIGQKFRDDINTNMNMSNIDGPNGLRKATSILNTAAMGIPQIAGNLVGTGMSFLEDIGRRITGNHRDGEYEVDGLITEQKIYDKFVQI